MADWPAAVTWEIRLISGNSQAGTVRTFVSSDTAPDEAPPWMHAVVEAVREWREVGPWYPISGGIAR